ncbi:hypothetical protein EYF80_003951 [Liparis tanakae]|uniref:Secreted protein n=1 Tax=Liparis tanakae TaxID=230148 RepID=A0A4Z2J729_9TELE|nr:hypothetical protein EYF80_003951 [Liparis tanakae]
MVVVVVVVVVVVSVGKNVGLLSEISGRHMSEHHDHDVRVCVVEQLLQPSICALIGQLSRCTVRVLNSTPMVVRLSWLNSFLVKRDRSSNEGLKVGLAVDEAHGGQLIQLGLEPHFWGLGLHGHI